MALIKYIAKKSRGKTVLEPVILKLDAGDRVRFRAHNKKTQLVLDDPNGYLTFMVTQPLGHPVGQATTKGKTLMVGVQGDKVGNASGVALSNALGTGLGDDPGGGLGDDVAGGVGDDVGGGGPPEATQAPKRKPKRRIKNDA